MSMYHKKSVEDVEIKAGTPVFVRCDFNVPMKDGKITSDKRIVEALPTIKYLLGKGAKVILSSHLGKPHNVLTEGSRRKRRRKSRHSRQRSRQPQRQKHSPPQRVTARSSL